MRFSTLMGAAVLCCFALVGCGGGGGGDIANQQTPSSPPSGGNNPGGGAPPPSGNPPATIFRLDNVAVASFPSGSLAAGADVVLRLENEPDRDIQFEDSTLVFGPIKGADLELVIDSSSAIVDSFTVQMNVPQEVQAWLTPGRALGVFAMTLYENLSEESGERSVDFSPLSAAYDSATRQVTVTVPSEYALEEPDGRRRVVLKLASVATRSFFITQEKAMSAWSKDASREMLGSPLHGDLVITDPYWALRKDREGNPRFHLGLDLRAPEGTQVYSMGDGYIEKVKVQGSCCGNNIEAECSLPLKRGFAVVVRHNDGSAMAYRHLTRGSVEGFTDNELCWAETNPARPKYPIARGAKLAKSGRSGEVPPHLHIEYANGVDVGGKDVDIDAYRMLRMNPLLAFSEPKLNPTKVVMRTGGIAQSVKVALVSADGREFLILRKQKGRENQFVVPATARGCNFDDTSIEDAFDAMEIKSDNNAVASIEEFPGEDDAAACAQGLLRHDGGTFKVKPGTSGNATVTFTAYAINTHLENPSALTDVVVHDDVPILNSVSCRWDVATYFWDNPFGWKDYALVARFEGEYTDSVTTSLLGVPKGSPKPLPGEFYTAGGNYNASDNPIGVRDGEPTVETMCGAGNQWIYDSAGIPSFNIPPWRLITCKSDSPSMKPFAHYWAHGAFSFEKRGANPPGWAGTDPTTLEWWALVLWHDLYGPVALQKIDCPAPPPP